ncbi:hypothetical protein JCM16303_006389 [Sporobolomyces ruberrimus]
MLSSILLALSTAAVVSAAPVSRLDASSSLLPNATQYNASVVYYEMNGNWGACGKKNADSDRVVGLPLEFYSKLSEVSPYCGEYVVVTNPIENISVVAKVADASTISKTLSVSMGTWDALHGSDDGLSLVNWRRANETEIAAANKAQSAPSHSEAPSSSSASSAPSSTTTYAAASKESKAPVASSTVASAEYTSSSSVERSSSSTPSSSSSAQKSSWTPSSSAEKKSSSTWSPSSSSSSSVYVAPSSSSSAAQNQRQAEPSTSSYEAPKTTSSSKAYVAPTTSYTPPKTTTTSQYVAPKTTTQAPASYGGNSGQATFYSQGGSAGSCGSVAGDYDMVVAMSSSFGGYNQYCGRTVNIRNTQNGKTISARVADTCPGCGYGSLDLSMGAFGALGSYDQGVLPISWSFA